MSRLSKDFAAPSYYKMSIIYARMREYENAEICLKYSIILDKRYFTQAKSELYFDKIIDNIQKFEEKASNLRIKYNENIVERVMEIISDNDFLELNKIDMI